MVDGLGEQFVVALCQRCHWKFLLYHGLLWIGELEFLPCFLIMRTCSVVIDGGICFLIILIVKYGHLAK